MTPESPPEARPQPGAPQPVPVGARACLTRLPYSARLVGPDVSTRARVVGGVGSGFKIQDPRSSRSYSSRIPTVGSPDSISIEHCGRLPPSRADVVSAGSPSVRDERIAGPSSDLLADRANRLKQQAHIASFGSLVTFVGSHRPLRGISRAAGSTR